MEDVSITEVERDGVTCGAGLRSGTLIRGTNQQQAKTVAEVRKDLDNGPPEKGVWLPVRPPPTAAPRPFCSGPLPPADGGKASRHEGSSQQGRVEQKVRPAFVAAQGMARFGRPAPAAQATGRPTGGG